MTLMVIGETFSLLQVPQVRILHRWVPGYRQVVPGGTTSLGVNDGGAGGCRWCMTGRFLLKSRVNRNRWKLSDTRRCSRWLPSHIELATMLGSPCNVQVAKLARWFTIIWQLIHRILL